MSGKDIAKHIYGTLAIFVFLGIYITEAVNPGITFGLFFKKAAAVAAGIAYTAHFGAEIILLVNNVYLKIWGRGATDSENRDK